MKQLKYAGVLLGAFLISGCSATDKTDEKSQAKDVLTAADTHEQKVKAEERSISRENEPAVSLNLNPSEKEELYNEYSSIVGKINAEYVQNFSLEPITMFADDSWVGAESFEKMLKERANTTIIVLKNKEAHAPSIVPKVLEIRTGSNVSFVKLEGSFETRFNSEKNVQELSALHSISSEIDSGSNGSWIQTGYNYSIVDNGRAYLITVGGKFSENGVISPHLIDVEFSSDKNGGIS